MLNDADYNRSWRVGRAGVPWGKTLRFTGGTVGAKYMVRGCANFESGSNGQRIRP